MQKDNKEGFKNKAIAETLATISDNYNDVLAFLQAVTVKSPQITAAPLYFCANKHEHIWFHWWSDTNIPTPPKLVPQDHSGLTSVLTNVINRLQTAEVLHPAFAGQREL